jgi:hypothetical protein
MLFKAVSTISGLAFSPTVQQAFEANPKVYEFRKPLDETDLEDFQVRVKQMNIGIFIFIFIFIFVNFILANHSEGFTLKLKASKRTGEEALRLYNLAIGKFKIALVSFIFVKFLSSFIRIVLQIIK